MTLFKIASKYRFYGQMVACAVFTAILASSTPASAHHKPDHVKGGGSVKQGAGPAKHGKVHKPRHGPPPWAPAHGYRKKFQYKSADGRMRVFVPADLVFLPDTGIGRCNRDTIGAVLGAVAGGVVGAELFEGNEKLLASIGGAIVGAVVGGNLGRAMDQVDQNCVGQVLEHAPTGAPVTWRDPDRGTSYNITPTRTYRDNSGQHCREYQTSGVIGGKVETMQGTACRKPDGSWEKTD